MTDTKLLFKKSRKAEKEFYQTLDELLQLAVELSPDSHITSIGDNNDKSQRKHKKKSRARKRARLSTTHRGVV